MMQSRGFVFNPYINAAFPCIKKYQEQVIDFISFIN